jgi:ribonuclease T1
MPIISMRLRLFRFLTPGLVSFLLLSGTASARGDRLLAVETSELPREAVITLELIARGGPFPHDRDGVVFGNRERILPPRPRGYYHEYTVRTPGVRGRGAKRIVCGGEPAATRDCYYSDDHYQTFRRIR